MNSLKSKLEVLIDQKLLVNSIRLSIIVTALLMGYIHSPKKSTEVSSITNEQTIFGFSQSSSSNIFN